MVGAEPANGIILLGAGDVANEALRQSALGMCLIVDRDARPASASRERE